MKIFKAVDEKFKELGFVKKEEGDKFIEYTRYESNHNYIHVINLVHKKSGKHIIQSFEKGLNTDKLNNMVGITPKEAMLCIKKMKKAGWK